MGEGWLTQILSNRWILAIGAYALGFLTVWLLQSRGWLKIGPRKTPGHPTSKLSDVAAVPERSEKLDALAAEIEKAKSMLEEQEADREASEEILDELDGAVKRANGRLKLILKSIKRQNRD